MSCPSALAEREPIGPSVIAILRRIRAAGGVCQLSGDDRETAYRARLLGLVAYGHVNTGPNARATVHITHSGRDYLDRLMRAH